MSYMYNREEGEMALTIPKVSTSACHCLLLGLGFLNYDIIGFYYKIPPSTMKIVILVCFVSCYHHRI